jgi:hypothetical protein
MFTRPATEIPRDRWGRPLIEPPDGGKPIGYTRVSSLDQNPARQLDQTQVDRVFTDQASGKDVRTVSDVTAAVAAAKSLKRPSILLFIERGKGRVFVPVKIKKS